MLFKPVIFMMKMLPIKKRLDFLTALIYFIKNSFLKPQKAL